MSDIDQKIAGVVERDNEEVKQENSNKNPTILSVQRDYMAGEWSRYYTNQYLLPDDILQAHKEGIIHFHDADYFAQHMHNCDLVNLDDMLQNGTCISGTRIDKPHSFVTACTVASQIVAQVASSQYGGQTITMSHLAPFVDISRKRIAKRLGEEFKTAGIETTDEKFNELVESELRKEVESGCQTIQYQLITLQSTNGQAPFVTVFLYLHEVPEGQLRDDLALIIEIMLKQRILGVKDRTGAYITPAFPKLIYVLQDDNIDPGTPYYYLTELAAKCTAKRMVPDYISEKKMKELKGDVYPCMGCRSFLTPDRFTDAGIGNIANAKDFVPGQHKYYGRFNQGVVTINLVDAACSSGKNEDLFWKIMNERLELCHRALQIRHNRLMGTPSDVAPILWQDGALARLAPGETIDKLLYHGYSTISLGYAGLAECVYYMKGISHTSGEGEEFGLKVMQLLNDKCQEWKKAEDIDYSVYGTPLESTTYKFAKCLQKRFGIIPNVTDHNYITNSYHVNVREEIDAFDKLSEEAKFQRLSPGGAVSYVEVPNMQNNIPAVLAIMKHIYNTILYAELNTKSDYCDVCGYNGEIKIVKDETGKLVWECPNCGNRDQSKMHVARRTCGYIGTQYWNQGRTQEIQDRVLHLSVGTCDVEEEKKEQADKH
jgi:ribonucleoside-triphosphate reductase